MALTSNKHRLILTDSTTGRGLTGLQYNSSGLIIGSITDNEATTTRYRANSSEIESITTLGTFAAPTSGKCRFKEVDATNHPGLYEIQLADARYSVASANKLIITISGYTGLVDAHLEIDLGLPNVEIWPGVLWQQHERRVASMLYCKGSGVGSSAGSGAYRDPADTKNVVAITHDGDGSRTAVTYDDA